jgi:hypothetical protein
MKETRGGKRDQADQKKAYLLKILTIKVAAAIHDELKNHLVKRMDDESA